MRRAFVAVSSGARAIGASGLGAVSCADAGICAGAGIGAGIGAGAGAVSAWVTGASVTSIRGWFCGTLEPISPACFLALPDFERGKGDGEI